MARLHFENLGFDRPASSLKSAFFGLRDYYEYLQHARNKLLDWKNAPQATWTEVKEDDLPESIEPVDGQVWIQLEAPPDDLGADLAPFLNEYNWIYEFEPPDEPDEVAKYAPFRKECQLDIWGRNEDEQLLCLSKLPATDMLVVRGNTYVVDCQRKALGALQGQPHPAHEPLVRLMQNRKFTTWPTVEPAHVDRWEVLRDEARPGNDQQRQFVEYALATPDFAFLEGPPGSGKTTTICELILQLVTRGKRVMLCASTHVAVDNVLERIAQRNEVIPIRIGDESNVSRGARDYCFRRFCRTERKRLRKFLSGQQELMASQKTLLDALNRDAEKVIERLVLDCANLVCGTTIGILQHPDIKRSRGNAIVPEFDVLIVDEASKTTFQEFLVPALRARKWILVGDRRQLSPYVDDMTLSENLDHCIPDENVRQAARDVFMLKNYPKNGAVAVSTSNAALRRAYEGQAAEHGVECCSIDDLSSSGEAKGLKLPSIVVDAPEVFSEALNLLPPDVTLLRSGNHRLPHRLERRVRFLRERNGIDDTTWGEEVSWRIVRVFERRLTHAWTPAQESQYQWVKKQFQRGFDQFAQQFSELAAQRHSAKSDDFYSRKVNELIEACRGSYSESQIADVREKIDRVRRVALPSVLECLQSGFNPDSTYPSALTHGIPSRILRKRQVKLEFQHRMHPELSEFPRTHVYADEALNDPDDMRDRRHWTFSRYESRTVWWDVKGGRNNYGAIPKEARVVVDELKAFEEWTRTNPGPEDGKWQVAILTFYRAQERELRSRLRQWTRQHRRARHFPVSPHLEVELATVDSFQGHEADVVFLSFARRRGVGFLDSLNRVNVAITRARYQLVLVGDVGLFEDCGAEHLEKLAASAPVNYAYAQGGHR